jgi:DNA (cytosine-5)-methyltransferase 1
MNVLSLFSGIGGLDLGLERAGMTVVGQVEIDPWCQRVLAKHWPEVPRYDDVRTAAEWWGDRPAPDLVAGGFPCQPVSEAGEKLAQADSRWLWPAFANVVRDLRPRYVLVENVPGLLRRGMGDVLGELASIGYDAEWDCVPAVFVGAPHIHERVFIVAYPACGGRDDTRLHRGRTWSGSGAGTPLAGESGGSRGDVADAERDGLERPGQSALTRQDATVLRRRPPEPGRWAPEPAVGRVADGVPARVDRLRGLGNAVVPQVGEYVGRMITEAAA